MDCGFKYCPIGLLISGYGSNSKYSLLGNGQCLILAMAKRQRTMTNLTTGAKVVMGCDLKIEVFCLLALRYRRRFFRVAFILVMARSPEFGSISSASELTVLCSISLPD
jgi:hypothetical protein